MSGASAGGHADMANRCSFAKIRARLRARGTNSFLLILWLQLVATTTRAFLCPCPALWPWPLLDSYLPCFSCRLSPLLSPRSQGRPMCRWYFELPSPKVVHKMWYNFAGDWKAFDSAFVQRNDM